MAMSQMLAVANGELILATAWPLLIRTALASAPGTLTNYATPIIAVSAQGPAEVAVPIKCKTIPY